MYESFYGLIEKPFNLLPDPDYLFMSQGHDNAYTHLEYAIAENKGFVVITGEIGAGKTTIINFLLRKIQQDVQVGLINNTSVAPSQLIRMICQEFEVDVAGRDKAQMLERFHGFLLKQFSQRRRVILIIDEAQNLAPETLEEIRMLSNLESEKHHLVQMILVGQPELKHKLQRSDLRQLAQRITVYCHINALGREEVDKYIQYRLRVAGAKDRHIFDKGAVATIYKYSRGIPRLINIICDAALVYGFADGIKRIDGNVVHNAVKEREAVRIASVKGREKASPASPPKLTVGKYIIQRMQIMENKVRSLEDAATRIDQKLETLLQQTQARNTIVLQLLRMLKRSLETRWKTLLMFSRLKKQWESKPQEAPEGPPKSQPALFARFKKKKGLRP